MAAEDSLVDRYGQLLEEIIQMTLKGKIRSKEQVLQLLAEQVSPGTGEMFERVLSDRLQSTEEQVKTLSDEMKLAKANRSLRALQTIQSEWQRLQNQNQTNQTLQAAITTITRVATGERLKTLLQVLDPNQSQPLNQQQLKHLAQALEQQQSDAETEADLKQMAAGLKAGLADWQRLEGHLVSWIYDQGRGQLGFAGLPGQQGPWELWSKQVGSELPRSLFQSLVLGQSLQEWAARQPELSLAGWVELAVLLSYLQQALVAWFDRMVYSAKLGAKLSISSYLVFAVFWSELAQGWRSNPHLASTHREQWTQASFQITLQILRTFSQQDYFPLYGGIFASFSGQYLRETLNYLDEPLRQAEGTQAKARILTLLGYSLRAQGQYDRAARFHQQALVIAQREGDRSCEIANFNHLSRLYIAQKNYPEAINTSQRALILSRQGGDRQGEANALVNLGFSEVLAAKAGEGEAEAYERAVELLNRGKQLSEQLGDRQSQSLCLSSLGIAQIMLDQPDAAIESLAYGWQAAQFSGDLYLQGLNLAYLAQAYYQLGMFGQAIFSGCLGMYILEQVGSEEWRQAAALMVVVRGQLGAIGFQNHLGSDRPKIIGEIGVDGYDYLLPLLQSYQDSLNQ